MLFLEVGPEKERKGDKKSEVPEAVPEPWALKTRPPREAMLLHAKVHSKVTLRLDFRNIKNTEKKSVLLGWRTGDSSKPVTSHLYLLNGTESDMGLEDGGSLFP